MKNLIISLLQIVVSGWGTISKYRTWNEYIKMRMPLKNGHYASIGNDGITGDFAKMSLILFLVSIVFFILLCIFKNKISKRASIIIAVIQIIFIIFVLFYETVFYSACQVI